PLSTPTKRGSHLRLRTALFSATATSHGSGAMPYAGSPIPCCLPPSTEHWRCSVWTTHHS
ncbi:hypothetical protein IWW45_009563, partial [Coemansia sp. RSA 485]